MNGEALARFHYWIRERHLIHLKKEAGRDKPWTNDPQMQNYFFTNPYRENDKTTVWFRDNVRRPLRGDCSVILATVIFRWFNLIETGKLLVNHQLLRVWKPEKALKVLGNLRDRGVPVFTGAFMINSPAGKPKLESIIERINNVWTARQKLKEQLPGKTLQAAHEILTQFPGLGGFMAYEIVCDLRYTYVLRDATDKLTWCNPGPGCVRGLYRIMGWEIENKSNATSPPRPENWQEIMVELLRLTQDKFRSDARFRSFEMREIEHSLCEFDKYERARLGDGRMKRVYKGM